MGVQWFQLITEAIRILNKEAANILQQEYQAWWQEHRFILTQLPDWKVFQSNRSNSLTPGQYRRVRVKVNRYIKRQAGRLLDKHKTVIIAPRHTNDAIEGVHYSTKSQKVYTKDIFNAVSKVICKHCTPTPGLSAKKLQKLQLCSTNACCRYNVGTTL